MFNEPAAVAPPTVAPRSPTELFVTFTVISMQSFGGALGFIERMVVQKKRWLTGPEFLGLFAISQALPGPTGASFCVLLGDRHFGLRGAAAALSGFLLLPAVIVLIVAAIFQHYQQVPAVQGALHGMGAAAVGLVLHTTSRMAKSLRGQRVGIVVALATFAAVAFLRLPVSMIMLTLGAASVAWAWRVLGQAGQAGQDEP